MQARGKILAAVMLSGLFVVALTATHPESAHAEPSDGDGNASGSAVLSISPAFGDSLLEVDRTLNFNRGPGSAGSDNEGGD